MYAWGEERCFGRMTTMEERMKIMYNENNRMPTHTVPHYITYLRRYVSQAANQRPFTPDRNHVVMCRSDPTERRGIKPVKGENQRSTDSISPLSYFIRKLKLDLQMSFPRFVEEFIQAPNNGLRLLLSLLKVIQSLSADPAGSLHGGSAKGTLKMDNYKQNMVDEQDCLLCIKYTLRIRNAVDEILEHNSGLFTVTTCLLSNFSRSRITALEILTLIISGPSSVDKVLEAFTSMRVTYAESTRFKMLINMLHTRGVSQVLFQVSCLRFLNTILNLCKSANMRVFLQYEMEEAGLDLNKIQESAQGDGLEYDDLRKEIREWKKRYIDVDSILRKIKADLKAELPGHALSEFTYDQHYGPVYKHSPVSGLEELRAASFPADYRAWSDPVPPKGNVCDLRLPKPNHPEQAPSEIASDTTAKAQTTHARDSTQADLQSASNLPSNETDRDNRRRPPRTPSPGVTGSQLPDGSNAPALLKEDTHIKSDKRISITSEVYEPYGLIIKTHPVSVVPCTEPGSQNWILGTSEQVKDGKHQLGHRNAYTQGALNDRCDSGISMNYPSNDAAEDAAKMYWKNFHPREKLVFCPEERSKDVCDDGKKHYEKKLPRQTTENMNEFSSSHFFTTSNFKRNGDLDQRPLRWQNAITPYSIVLPTQGSSVTDLNRENNGRPRTPSPDYSREIREGVAFSPRQSSTMRVGLKVPGARNLLLVGDKEQRDHVTSFQNSRRLVSKQTSPKAHDLEHQVSSQNSYYFTENHKPSWPQLSKESTDTMIRAGSYNNLDANIHSENLPQPSDSRKQMFEYLKAPSAVSNIRVSTRNNKTQSVPVTRNISAESMTSFTSPHSSQVTSFRSQQTSREDVSPKFPVSVSKDEKLISRSLSSLTTNKDEQNESSLGKTQQSPSVDCAQDNANRITTRRHSLSERRPSYEPEHRNSFVTLTASTQDNSKKTLSLDESAYKGMDSMRSYSAEIGQVLGDLDRALEKHGWESSLKASIKQQRSPLVAYV